MICMYKVQNYTIINDEILGILLPQKSGKQLFYYEWRPCNSEEADRAFKVLVIFFHKPG